MRGDACPVKLIGTHEGVKVLACLHRRAGGEIRAVVLRHRVSEMNQFGPDHTDNDGVDVGLLSVVHPPVGIKDQVVHDNAGQHVGRQHARA